MSKRQYRGLSKINYYLLKEDWLRYRGSRGQVRTWPAGTKMLYWFDSSHSVQHLGTVYEHVTTNPENGPMVVQAITGVRQTLFVAPKLTHRDRLILRRERGPWPPVDG